MLLGACTGASDFGAFHLRDAGSEVDAGLPADAAADAGLDAGSDASFDAGVDAGFDAGPPPCVPEECFWGRCLDSTRCDDPIAVDATYVSACALRPSGEVVCWGGNGRGHLGTGQVADTSPPTVVACVPPIDQVDTGIGLTCFRSVAGEVFCSGENDRGILGIGAVTGDEIVPLRVRLPEGTAAVDIAAAAYHACAVLDGGEVWCWGSNDRYRAGDGEENPVLSPQRIDGVLASEIATGDAHSCALDLAGNIACWGGNWLAQGGAGDTVDPQRVPRLVQSPTSAAPFEAEHLFSGWLSNCTTNAGVVHCWGNDGEGEMGNDRPFIAETRPAPLPLPDDVRVREVAQDQHGCAVAEDGRLFCWGRNHWGESAPDQLPDELGTSARPTLTPRQVPGVEHALDVATAYGFTCYVEALAGTARAVRCFGHNGGSKLGRLDSSIIYSPAPLDVATPIDPGVSCPGE